MLRRNWHCWVVSHSRVPWVQYLQKDINFVWLHLDDPILSQKCTNILYQDHTTMVFCDNDFSMLQPFAVFGPEGLNIAAEVVGYYWLLLSPPSLSCGCSFVDKTFFPSFAAILHAFPLARVDSTMWKHSRGETYASIKYTKSICTELNVTYRAPDKGKIGRRFKTS